MYFYIKPLQKVTTLEVNDSAFQVQCRLKTNHYAYGQASIVYTIQSSQHAFANKSQIPSLPSFVLNDKFPKTVELFLYIPISITILMITLK
jgi:hypothetical protein